MKSDRTAPALAETRDPPRDPFQSLLEAIEHPAALCDGGLRLVASNAAFDALCRSRARAGRPLGELLEGPWHPPPPGGEATEVRVERVDGAALSFTLSRRGEMIALLGQGLLRSGEPGAAPAGALVHRVRVEQALLEIGRDVALAFSEEELVAVVARSVKGLFPGSHFCVRICDQRTAQLTSLYAEGRLLEGAPEVMVFRRSAAEKTQLRIDDLPSARVRIVDDEVPHLFEGTQRALCAPLVAAGQLFGVISVEYPHGAGGDPEADNHLLVQLANQVAVGIRNAKLIDELTFVRKYLEELIEHANALILVADRERRVVVYNRMLVRLTGMAREEVLGRDLLTLVPDSERLRIMRLVASSLRGEPVSNVETRVLDREGREVRVSFSTSAVLGARGEVEGVIAIGQDLTQVRELEKRVIQAEKMASLGQLAASVAHEINNPMTAVATYSDALLKRSLLQPGVDPRDQEKLRKILDNSQRILRFTGDLVSYARPADDRPQTVDLEGLLDKSVGYCDHLLSQHGLQVVRQYGKVPPISAVRSNLVQVFVNLITNACHAMESGGEVRLSTRVEGTDVVASVSDCGKGIEGELLERIFEPFFTTKPDGRGTGLGLSIVQGIVEKHGGAVAVSSEMGKGTTFTVRLPLPL